MENAVTLDEIIENSSDLDNAIKRLERKKMSQEEEITEQFHGILEEFTPNNILRKTLQEVQASTPLRHNLLKLALGLGVGYFSRKLIVGKSAGIVKKALGTALQFGITHLIARKENSGDENENPTRRRGLLRRILSI